MDSRDNVTAFPPVEPLDPRREWPLSHAQRRIWLMEQLEPGTCLGNVSGILHARGQVDVPRLAEAVRAFIAHAPALRLRFFTRGGEAVQRLADRPEGDVEVLDFSGSGSPREDCARWCEAAARTPFTLREQPLYRFAVLRQGPEDVLLFANVHHLIGDAVSLGLFAREVTRLYTRRGEPRPVGSTPGVTYPDLVLEERRYLASEAGVREGAAWRERFASFDSPSTLGRPTSLRPSTKATRHSRQLEAPETQALHAFARREGTTLARLFTTLAAVFVGRVSGKADVCIGTYTHNRFSREQLGMFGMFVGTLPLRFQLPPSETLSAALAGGALVIQRALKGARHPYDRLLEDLDAPGALFDVVVSYQNAAYEKTLEGAPVRIQWLFNGHEAHALAIHISDRVDEGQLTLDFDFRDDSFAPGVPEQLIESFLYLLSTVVESPGTRSLAELPLVSPRQLEGLRALNPPELSFPRHLQVQHLFEQAARAHPDAVAVRSAARVLTYGELEAQASVLARRLQMRGVGPGACVGLWTGRTPDLLVALLGILKSGAGYLALDPSHPHARVEFMLRDAQARALVVDVGTAVPEGAFGVEVLRVGEQGADEAPPAREGSPTDLAYILYTSGSSGMPKGVMLEHHSVVNFLTGMMHALPLESVRRVLCTTTVSFDIFVLETLLPLALGREVLLASEEEQRDPGALAGLMSRTRPDLVQLTPSRLQLLLEHPSGLEALRGVSLLLVGGEALPPLVLERLGALTATRIFNMYGPTETTVWSTCAELTGSGHVHVGRPIQNTRVFVADARGEPLPRGVIGEVCIGGEGVARGYLHRPELDRERFGTPSFAPERFYRTGDLGHWLPSGDLVVLGRVDAQLKIRGHRIEPGEIEAQLLRTGAVSAAAVLGRTDATGGLSLVAFYVPRNGAEAPREALRAVLPPYMVPARWVALETMPVLPSGKIDRKALARVELPDVLEHESVEPANALEARLRDLWRDVLGVRGFGVTDSFFDLGGHSLGAITLVNRIDAELGRRLSVSEIFAHPSIRQLAARLADAGQSARPTPEALAPQAFYAVTPLQKTMYAVHERAGADNTGHHMTGALRVRGPLDPARLQAAFEQLLRRHEALRTSFESHEGEVVQRVHAQVPFALEDLPAEGRSLDELVSGFVRPFDPGHAPLLRAGLCRDSAQDATLVVDLHHLIADGASTGILLEELAALLANEPLAEPPAQPKEFAAWQARVRDSAVGEAAAAYWKARFAVPPAPLELPTDRPRPRVPSFDADTWSVSVPEPLTRQLLARCHEARVTPFVFLLAAYELLLSRHAASPDVVVVTPVLGRGHPAFARTVGLFVNTVALRSVLQEEVPVRELLAELATRTREALDHPELPVELLLDPSVSRGGRGLGDFLFTLAEEQDAPVRAAQGVTLRRLEPSIRTAQYDLELTAALTASPALTLRWTYKTCLFERARVEDMAARYVRLLEGLLEDLSRPLRAVSMLTPGDLAALSASRGPVVDHPPRTLAQLFEAQVDRTPEAPALEFEGERLTYRQLEAWTNQLAHQLVALGVGPNVRVGVCLERSFELVVSLLAVTKSGGAYVPLDPTYPEKRLAFMVEDARPRVLLVQERLRPRFADHAGELLAVDAWDRDAGHSRERLPSRAGVDDLAYVIYTSGSTGQPKGAMNAHRGISNRLQWMQARYGLTPDDAVLQKTPFSFDVSVWEFFWTLMAGARLVIARPEGHKDPAYLADLVAARGITTLHFVPSMLEAFVGEGALPRCPSLRQVLCSGEALSLSLQQRFFAQAPAHVRLHNLYGPTEAAVDVSAWECERQPTRPLVPIGLPIDNVQLYNLDRYLNPVPVDVRGELYIGGVAVGVGYLGRPELTAQRFVSDPFSDAPGARLYRTGDRCRVLADGAVDYLGRIDGQIKLRGLRIELGEIEALLTQHPSLAEGAVLLREDVPGQPRLVAYVRPQEPDTFSLATLQSHLRANLPAHMVPTAWVVLRTLPVTPNGKLDRAALPVPEASQEAYVAPRGATEERLAALWSEVLGVARVGRDDDFFALGGHSLLATGLASRIRATFAVDLPLRTLFDFGTLAAQAERIDGGAAAQEGRIARAGDALRHQLSFAQQRLWFLSQLEPGSPLYNIAGVARLRGALEVAALTRVLERQVARHEVFRTSFVPVDGLPRATVAEHVPFALTVLDMSQRSGPEVDAWVSEECRRPFELTRAPLLRATLLRRSEGEHLLVLVVHHIICDGWSLGLLLRELEALYAHPSTPEAAPALQYLDYAVWERERLAGPRFERELEHWKERLGLHPPVLDLPTDRARPAVQTFRGALLQKELSGELTQALTALGHETGATLFMTLLTGFKALLFRYTRQSELIVGTPIANRTRAETEEIVGCFVNTLALKTRPSGTMTFSRLLAEVRDVTLDAYAHQHVPFEKVVEAVKPARDLSRSPLVQVMFSLENIPEVKASRSGLQVEPLELDTGASRFDLSLSVMPRPEGLRLTFEYNTDLFDRSTIERMHGQLETLLGAAVRAPHTPLGALELLTARETRRLLDFEPGAMRDAGTGATSFVELFERQVALHPRSLALRHGERTLSYEELNARANQLAHVLRARGVGSEVLVAVCLERSVEAVVAFLAIFKAGGAYVPLDPSHPPERLGLILREARALHVLDLRTLEELEEEVRRAPTTDPRVQCLPESLAYVIYTSGSTGRPKGVMVSHRNLATFLESMAALYRLGPEDRMLQFASLSVDTSVMELYPPLIVGGAAILRTEEMMNSVRAYLEDCGRWGVTFIKPPTSYWSEMTFELSLGDVRLPPSVRLVGVGGEKMQPGRAIEWKRLVDPRVRLYNEYGPTETTVMMTACDITALDEVRLTQAEAPLGMPLAHARVYLLDPEGRRVPEGVPGELCVGGILVTRGYHDRPDLTAQLFVPDPFSGVPGARMYRSGDKARWWGDGTLEYLGRLDEQVKIRGFRVEPGELEALLNAHASVREAAVVVRDDAQGQKHLVAYVVVEDAAVDVAALKLYLRDRVPDYMLPSRIVLMPDLPIGPSDKIDRAALPLVALHGADDREYIAPRTEAEQRLAEIWRTVLQVERVGASDHFFDLGGHSLLATQLVSRVRQAFGVEVPLTLLFEKPTLAALAEELERRERASAGPQLRKLSRADLKNRKPRG